MFRAWTKFAGILLLAAVPAFAADKYTDPDSPQVQAAARKALATAKILDIRGIQLGISADLKDLNAKITNREIRVDLAADVLFDFDKYTLRPEANGTLTKVGVVVASYASAPVLIEGHTDGIGTHEYNMKLSQNRAESVKKWLVANAGISPGRITATGWGETRPVAPNKKPDGSDDPEGRQKNRRVELTLRMKQ